MILISETPQNLSPSCMRFAQFWIYDLSSLHDFWKNNPKLQQQGILGPNVWRALFKVYRLHTFSPISHLKLFALDFHQHFKNKISPKNIDDIFHILRRLGLHRMGNLSRLSTSDIQKRFGKAWADFFRGILDPESTPWPWQPYQENPPLTWKDEFEIPCHEAGLILKSLQRGLQELASSHPSFLVSELHLQLVLYEFSEDRLIELSFTHPYLLSAHQRWFLKILGERLHSLQLPSAVTHLHLIMRGTPPLQNLQLSLFEKRAKTLSWNHLCQRLLDQDFSVFQPESCPSHIPEQSWKRGSPFQKLKLQESNPETDLFRPLIQHLPEALSPHEQAIERKHFNERLTWLDEKGIRHQRDYFIARSTHHWIWIFKDETGKWFKQGIVE